MIEVTSQIIRIDNIDNEIYKAFKSPRQYRKVLSMVSSSLDGPLDIMMGRLELVEV